MSFYELSHLYKYPVSFTVITITLWDRKTIFMQFLFQLTPETKVRVHLNMIHRLVEFNTSFLDIECVLK